MDEEVSEVVDLVHSLVLQSRPPPGPLEEALSLSASRTTPSKITTVKSVPSSPCNSIPRSQTVPVRKKVQIQSAPLKPPDIGNSSLFPSVEEAALQDAMSLASRRITPLRSPTTTPTSESRWGGGGGGSSKLSNGGTGAISKTDISGSGEGDKQSERDKKLKTLEAKLTGPLGFQGEGPSTPSSGGNPRRASLTELSSTTTTPSRKTPRSGKLFSELSPERRQKLDQLAEKYSKSIDSNQCRSILDELEFLFQLFNSNNVMKGTKECEIPLLTSAAEQAYFVIKIVISQLDKIFVSMPWSILQLINENYPHKIPKPVRKHIEDWVAVQKSKIVMSGSVSDVIPVDLAKTVTFKSDKDGRANFLQQTDFHKFCKQRDLFYAIRDVWSSSGGNGGGGSPGGSDGGIIMDRNKARMSFPPVQHGGSSASRYVDTFSLKVQSLFQINQNPTNLFHLASLFVSHYLLEARALEVGGVPKDDNMKEFFQSNPMKLLQLNSRFSETSAETLENDKSSNLAFRKQFLLLSSGKFVQHVVDRLVMEITKVEGSMECADLANPGNVSRNIKDTIHLAKLLGFAHCMPYLADDKKQAQSVNIPSMEKESVIREHVLFRSYQTPPVDLKYFVEKASKTGRLAATCPWIIEYLLQCDPVAFLLPSYQPILKTIIHLYKTKLSHQCTSVLSTSNKNFLRFYFGLLFSLKNFPDTMLVQLRSMQFSIDDKEQLQCDSVHELLVDSMEDIGRGLVEFCFEENLNRFKRILSWGKLEVSHSAITGDFRHIRPIPASEKSSAPLNTSKLVCKEKMMQIKLEATFFELYSPSIKRSVDFIAERMASNFIIVAKSHLFPNVRNILANQGIFGVRAAEKCRMKLGDEMHKYLTEKCCATVKVFLEHTVTAGVLGLCQRVAIRKSKENGAEWIQNYINADMFPNMLENCEVPGPFISPVTSLQASSTPPSIQNESEEPPFEILILMHKMLRKLNSQEKVDPLLIDKVLSCQTFSKAPWAFSSLIDWGMSLVTYQPQSLTSDRMKQLVAIWKSLWTPTSNILNARNLMLLAQSNSPRDSWIKLGSITQLLISEGILKTENLEQQCFALLHDDWPDEIQKRISEYLTIVKEAFEGKAEWNSESAQVLDWVAWLCSGQPDQD